MHCTSKASTSVASMLSSFEMNGMCILVYGLINFMRTCVRIFLKRSEIKKNINHHQLPHTTCYSIQLLAQPDILLTKLSSEDSYCQH